MRRRPRTGLPVLAASATHPVMATSPMIDGHCAPRFAAVRDAFAANFEAGREIGASLAATVDGEFVVDLWGGHADAAKTRRWERDTIINVFSTTKAMTALCIHMLVDRGQLDVDAPVARYWPEFARAGKERITTRQVLSHSSGLAGIRQPLGTEALYDWTRMTAALAAESPWWEPGTASGYHALTYGYVLGELVQRITGRTLGAFFRDEVAAPLGADFHIGLPASEDARVAELVSPSTEENAAAGATTAVDGETLARKGDQQPAAPSRARQPPGMAASRDPGRQRSRQCPLGGACHGAARLRREARRLRGCSTSRRSPEPSRSSATPRIWCSASRCAGASGSC